MHPSVAGPSFGSQGNSRRRRCRPFAKGGSTRERLGGAQRARVTCAGVGGGCRIWSGGTRVKSWARCYSKKGNPMSSTSEFLASGSMRRRRFACMVHTCICVVPVPDHSPTVRCGVRQPVDR
eukprot:2520056-Rhodomonas_salina.3